MLSAVLQIIAATVMGCAAASAASAWEALPQTPPIPADNPQTPAKIELGKQLYFDPRLSIDGTVSCNSCHNVMEAGDDNRPTSVGVGGNKGERNAPTVYNAAFLSVQFWDGRAKSLEEQAAGPIVNKIEMGFPNHQLVIDRIQQIPGYVEAFASVFGGKGEAAVTITNVTKAIAAYERTLITPNAPFDRWVRGEKRAISKQAQTGAELFVSVGCIACHSGPAFAGPTLPEGTGFYQRFPTFPDSPYTAKYNLSADTGRFQVTQQEADKHMFRVPTLRNVALTAPYFHNGAVPTLEEAVRVMASTQLNKTLTDAEVAALVAFLETLTGEFPVQTMPRLPGVPGRTVVSAQ